MPVSTDKVEEKHQDLRENESKKSGEQNSPMLHKRLKAVALASMLHTGRT
jgi:hypothetical protein